MSEQKRYRVAVDVMGGDHAPQEPIAGALEAARSGLADIILVGDPDVVQSGLAPHSLDSLPVRMVSSHGTITEGDHPVTALRRNPKASVAVAAALVRAGEADALVSMGSTGAVMAASVLALGLFGGLERPALGGPVIPLAPHVSLIDLGSSVDCRPSQLASFATIGATFARLVQNIEHPRVALLSVGEEEGKGNRQVRETWPLLKASGLNFVGNVEGQDIFLDKADVVICDGFVGNVLLKYTEGLTMAIVRHMSAGLKSQFPAPVIKSMLRDFLALTSPAEESGGPLYGINGIAIVGHGKSPASAIARSIEMACHTLKSNLVQKMKEDLELAQRRMGT
jgi:glycerol-3-phosphate acyltransferase PlsX